MLANYINYLDIVNRENLFARSFGMSFIHPFTDQKRSKGLSVCNCVTSTLELGKTADIYLFPVLPGPS